MQAKLLDIIGHGESNAVKMSELAQMLKIEQRDVRRELSKARKAGAVVAYSSKGVFYPESIDELRQYISTESAKLRTQTAALQPAKMRLKKMTGFRQKARDILSNESRNKS